MPDLGLHYDARVNALGASSCKLFLGLEVTSYIQAADDSERTYSPA